MQRAGYLVEMVTTARGVKYFRNLRDENGKKIRAPEGDPVAVFEQKAKAKKAKASKKAKRAHKAYAKKDKGAFKTEEVITSRGVKYLRFIRDAEGNKIPLSEMEVQAQAEKVVQAKKAIKKLNKLQKEKSVKNIVPKDIADEMLRLMEAKKNVRCGEFCEKGRVWRVVLVNGDWLLIHMVSKMGDNKWGFFNPKKNQTVPFDFKAYQARGDKVVGWPEV